MKKIQEKFWGNIPISKSSKGWRIFPAFLKRLLHAFTRYFPMLPSMRASLHRWRGVKVGKNVFIGAEVFIDDAEPSFVTIEDETTILARSTILGHAYYPKHFSKILKAAGDKKKVEVKKGAYVGLGCIVLPGVTIGEYSIIGAGSIVTKDIPAYCVALGAPAKVVRKFSKKDLTI
ncbi:acyltransferase [Candidatus Peregrinibacteria bacterium]|jgi:acetyltransferase-like isoleucine patch superfamily enzyme|nr:acyltransferase [Candidatus Peregrinibacteria bacterium]